MSNGAWCGRFRTRVVDFLDSTRKIDPEWQRILSDIENEYPHNYDVVTRNGHAEE